MKNGTRYEHCVKGTIGKNDFSPIKETKLPVS